MDYIYINGPLFIYFACQGSSEYQTKPERMKNTKSSGQVNEDRTRRHQWVGCHGPNARSGRRRRRPWRALRLPGLHLLLAPQPRHGREPYPCRPRHRAGLGDEEDARRRPLLIIQGVVRLRHVLVRPTARHRRMNNPVYIWSHRRHMYAQKIMNYLVSGHLANILD